MVVYFLVLQVLTYPFNRHEMQGVLAEFKCAFSNNFRGCRRGFDRGCTNAWGLEGLKYVLMKKCFLGPFGILLPTCDPNCGISELALSGASVFSVIRTSEFMNYCYKFLQFHLLQIFPQGLQVAISGTCVPGMVHFPGSGGMCPNLMKVLGGNFLLTRLGADQIYHFLSSRFFQVYSGISDSLSKEWVGRDFLCPRVPMDADKIQDVAGSNYPQEVDGKKSRKGVSSRWVFHDPPMKVSTGFDKPSNYK
ncbi:hypothetical protein PGTUg99_020101 [Puccinia graminis f. sp. tritici]|uniref:Uncharacterized protein n=1 Tax=Puccinia graminis f. sp. tritici TaxID=56615 RepID=A0A5B0R4E2_PUCGR|nr:hypothetical protein PGTUg99_020101 [Puccinia graminis f. sp. tritici]